MLNLRKQKTATVEIAGKGGTYRFTFARISAMGDMRYHAYRSKAMKFIKSITGQEVDKFVVAFNAVGADAEAWSVALAALAHPRIISALQAIHFQKYATDVGKDDAEVEKEVEKEVGEWVEQPIPEEWREIEDFFDAIDKPEIALLDNAAIECNRDLWFVEQSGTAKKKDSANGK